MSEFACAKCGSNEYSRNEMRAEGGFLSAAFDVSTNRFIAVSCKRCGFTELYRKDIAGASRVFDFLVS